MFLRFVFVSLRLISANISLVEAFPSHWDRTHVQMALHKPEALSPSNENVHQTRLILLILLDVIKNLRLLFFTCTYCHKGLADQTVASPLSEFMLKDCLISTECVLHEKSVWFELFNPANFSFMNPFIQNEHKISLR